MPARKAGADRKRFQIFWHDKLGDRDVCGTRSPPLWGRCPTGQRGVISPPAPASSSPPSVTYGDISPAREEIGLTIPSPTKPTVWPCRSKPVFCILCHKGRGGHRSLHRHPGLDPGSSSVCVGRRGRLFGKRGPTEAVFRPLSGNAPDRFSSPYGSIVPAANSCDNRRHGRRPNWLKTAIPSPAAQNIVSWHSPQHLMRSRHTRSCCSQYQLGVDGMSNTRAVIATGCGLLPDDPPSRTWSRKAKGRRCLRGTILQAHIKGELWVARNAALVSITLIFFNMRQIK